VAAIRGWNKIITWRVGGAASNMQATSTSSFVTATSARRHWSVPWSSAGIGLGYSFSETNEGMLHGGCRWLTEKGGVVVVVVVKKKKPPFYLIDI